MKTYTLQLNKSIFIDELITVEAGSADEASLKALTGDVISRENIGESRSSKITKHPEEVGKEASPLRYVECKGGVAVAECYESAEGHLKIPSTIDGLPVLGIGQYAFMNCTKLTSITIPDSVTGIGVRAFEDCISLTSITIGNGVESIWDRAFAYCRSLTRITIPDNVTSIGYAAFYDCESLKSVEFANTESIPKMGEGVFRSCSKFKGITFTS